MLDIFISTSSATGWRNLALGMPTNQSSIESNGASARAVDGNQAINYGSNSCSFTKKDNPSWWKVNLTAEYNIKQIIAYHRDDGCCVKYLDSANVYVDDTLCGKFKWTGANPYILTCPTEIIGMVVSIYLLKDLHLILCEVEVMGTDIPFKFTNVDKPLYLPHGQSTKFPVQLKYAKGIPQPTVSITPSSNNVYIENNTIIIENSTKSIQGGYILHASNNDNVVAETVLSLKVSGERPVFVGEISQYNMIHPMVKYELVATSFGVPSPTMTLKKC